MVVDCGACSAQNFISAERLAVRDIPPRCWECGRPLAVRADDALAGRGTAPESAGAGPESNGGTDGK